MTAPRHEIYAAVATVGLCALGVAVAAGVIVG
jgi:hypothetical protein